MHLILILQSMIDSNRRRLHPLLSSECTFAHQKPHPHTAFINIPWPVQRHTLVVVAAAPCFFPIRIRLFVNTFCLPKAHLSAHLSKVHNYYIMAAQPSRDIMQLHISYALYSSPYMYVYAFYVFISPPFIIINKCVTLRSSGCVLVAFANARKNINFMHNLSSQNYHGWVWVCVRMNAT